MKLLAVLGLFLACNSAQAFFHAECVAVWTISESCTSAQQKVVDQIAAYDNDNCGTPPGATEPSGQKCKYKLTDNSGNVVSGTHTTPIQLYLDEFTMTFVDQPAGGCQIDGYSRSTPESVLDYGTNFCNLYNLLDGPLAMLTSDPGFTEETDDSICTQYSERDCDVY